MTKSQYAQEYLGEFIDELVQFFPDELIRKCMLAQRRKIIPQGDYFIGVDVGGLGGDASTFEIIDRTNRDKLIHIENISLTQTLTTDVSRKILELDRAYKFKKIYVDDGGIGFGVFSELIEDEQTRRRTVAINNASRIKDKDGTKKKLMKEELYHNLLNLMEKRKIQFLDDPEIFQSLKSVQYEFTDGGTMKIFGRDTHIAEGLIRAAWSTKDKSLNIYIY